MTPIDKQIKQKIYLFLSDYLIWMIVFISFIILLFGLGILYKVKYKAVKENYNSIITQQGSQLSEYENFLTDFNKIEDYYNSISAADIKNINEILPEKPEKEKLISQLEKLVMKNGLIMAAIKIDGGKTEEPVQSANPIDQIGELKIGIDIMGGNYKSLISLLNTLENNLRIINIKKLSFIPNAGINLEFSTYYLKEGKFNIKNTAQINKSFFENKQYRDLTSGADYDSTSLQAGKEDPFSP